MKTKIQKQFVDTAFGFPVYLLNVPVVKVRGVWTPKVNYKQLSKTVLQMLIMKPSRITGNELKFIRNYFQMTLANFADKFYVTHPAVIKWEKQLDKPTKMNWLTEKDIRLFIYHSISNGQNFSSIYEQLQQKRPNKPRRTKIDISEKEAILV